MVQNTFYVFFGRFVVSMNASELCQVIRLIKVLMNIESGMKSAVNTDASSTLTKLTLMNRQLDA